MTAKENSAPARAVDSFRRRIDAFFSAPQVADLAASLTAQAVPALATTKQALSSRLDHALTRLGSEPASEGLRLRKSLTLHDGRVVSMTGDATPLGAGQDVRIVTTTTTVLDAERLRTETSVLVFEQKGGD